MQRWSSESKKNKKHAAYFFKLDDLLALQMKPQMWDRNYIGFIYQLKVYNKLQ